MTCSSIIKENLKKYKNKRILLSDISKFVSANTEYEDFASAIQALMDEGILSPIKANGYNKRVINLPNKFQLSKERLEGNHKHNLQQCVQSLSADIDLDYYFKHREDDWLQDKKHILIVDMYIKEKGLPTEGATIPERSYQVCGDEKWLQEKGGLQVLERINLIEKMKLIKEVEPAAFALNKTFQDHQIYKHLIVENKSIFYRILDFLDESSYSSLIYGAGWRVISSIQSFKRQFSFEDRNQIFYYFGDLDYEGIKIWQTLNDSFEHVADIVPDQVLYRRLLSLPSSQGKDNQKPHITALAAFCEAAALDDGEMDHLVNLLRSGYYLPQEALSVKVLKKLLIENQKDK